MNGRFKHFGHLLVSIVVALFLFFYATTVNYRNSLASNPVSNTETYTHTINYVPVEVEYDSDQYFISGFTSTVTVSLTGSNRVVLQSETDESTRSFKVTADLTKLDSGTHTVDLVVSGLPTGVTATVDPASITVKMGQRETKTFDVVGMIYENQVAEGYSVSKISVSDSTVKVTTDEETMANIDRVEAVVLDATDLESDISQTATLQAVDSEGNVLPVVFSIEETTLQATITKDK